MPQWLPPMLDVPICCRRFTVDWPENTRIHLLRPSQVTKIEASVSLLSGPATGRPRENTQKYKKTRSQRSFFVFTAKHGPLTLLSCNSRLAWVKVNPWKDHILFLFNPLWRAIRRFFERPLTSVCGRSGRKRVGNETSAVIGWRLFPRRTKWWPFWFYSAFPSSQASTSTAPTWLSMFLSFTH